MQEFQGIHNRYEGRVEERERRVVQVIGTEAREAQRGQRGRMLPEHQVGEWAKESVKSQMRLELQSHIVSYKRSLHDREVQKERIAQNLEYQEAQL